MCIRDRAMAWITSNGMRCVPMAKKRRLRAVCARAECRTLTWVTDSRFGVLSSKRIGGERWHGRSGLRHPVSGEERGARVPIKTVVRMASRSA